jgi:hypothetical protein
MRSLWVIVLVVITALGVTSVASASMRDEVRALIDSAATLTADDGTDIPDEPAPEPDEGDEGDVDDGDVDDGDEGDVDDGDEGDVDDGPPYRADKEPSGDGTCTATRAQNGNTWRIGEPQYQNHGAAVSAVAKSQAGKTDKSAD